MKKILCALCCLGAAMACSNAHADLVLGTTIGFDFGAAQLVGVPLNYNFDAAPTGVSETFTNVIETDFTALTGVDFTFNYTTNGNGDGGDSITSNAAIPISAQNDHFFEFSSEQWLLTFSGLNPSYEYELTIGSHFLDEGQPDVNENNNTGWEVGGVQMGTVATSATDSYVTFSDITPTTGGDIAIQTYDLRGNTFSTLSALTLTVTSVPEPSSFGLLGLVGIAGLVRRR